MTRKQDLSSCPQHALPSQAYQQASPPIDSQVDLQADPHRGRGRDHFVEYGTEIIDDEQRELSEFAHAVMNVHIENRPYHEAFMRQAIDMVCVMLYFCVYCLSPCLRNALSSYSCPLSQTLLVGASLVRLYVEPCHVADATRPS